MKQLLMFTFSFVLVVLIVPQLIAVANAKHLYDDPGCLLKIHSRSVPRLGGVAIFFGFTITLLSLGYHAPFLQVNYLVTASLIIFALGLKDDLTGVGHRTKFSVEIIAGLILTIPGNIRLHSLHGLFNIHELPWSISILISLLILVLITNAFNLIDGIDGLAAATGIMVHLLFAAMFIYMEQFEMAGISLSLCGALSGFLVFNLTPARIFMGDTGSLLTGMVSAVMALKLIEVSDNNLQTGSLITAQFSAILALAVLAGPVADTFRVFILRLLSSKSPFSGDLNHMHHRMVQLGLSHAQTTTILILLNLLVVLMVFLYLHNDQPAYPT